MRTVFLVGVLLAASTTPAWAADECSPYARLDDDEYAKLAIGRMSGCNDYWVDGAQGAYWLDRSDRQPVSEIARVFHVSACYDNKDGRYVALPCALDAERLNRAAFEAEVAKLPLSNERKAKMKAFFADTEKEIKKANEDIAFAYKTQPHSKEVMAAAEAAFKDWDNFYREHKALLDSVAAVEDRYYRLDLNQKNQTVDLGCDDLHTAWRNWVKSKNIPNYKQLAAAIATDELAVVTLRSMAVCDAAGGRNIDAIVEAEAVRKAFPFRGPRMHALWAALQQMAKVIPEDQDPGLRPAEFNARNDSVSQMALDRAGYNFRASAWDQLQQGTIDKITKGPQGYAVTFKKQSWMEPDYECKDLPTRWWSTVDNRWKHDFSCKQVGSHPASSQLDPRTFSLASGEGLKPGQVVTLRPGNGNASGDVGFPMEARTPAKGAKQTKKKIATARGADLSIAGTLDVVYGVPLR